MAKKLWLGIVVGAAAGGAIALLDRETREKTFQKAANLKTDAQYLYYNRDEVKEKATGSVGKVKGLINNIVENKEFYLEKIAELTESMPQLNQQIQQTKEAFGKKDKIVDTSQQAEPLYEEEVAKPDDVIHL
ncbi:MAG: YtxH domain-containing protein [Kurthia sp.]|nr:YtxH domain-containing protein [Candidatus Kurthia equi]